jgi:UDP-glucose 4-epimerase
VADVVRALAALIDDPRAYGGVFNVGATTEISILDLARRIIELTGSSSDLALIPYDDAYGDGFEDMYRRVPDTAKIEGLIGWTPTHTLDDIIGEVVAHQMAGEADVSESDLAGME